MKTKMTVVALVFALSACASTIGTRIEAGKTSDFTVGVTTESDVVQRLGAPFTVTSKSEGGKDLTYWSHSSKLDAASYIPVVGIFAGGAKVQSQYVTVTFDKDGHFLRTTTSDSDTHMKNTDLIFGKQ